MLLLIFIVKGNNGMRVIKNYLYNTLYQLFVLIVPFVTIPYTSRVLGISGIGINSFTTSITQYFVLLANLGVTIYGQREIAFSRDNVKSMSQKFWEIELLSIISALISLCAFSIFLIIYGKYSLYFLAQSLLIFAAAADISWLFMGLEKFSITVLRNFIVKIISLILIFTLVKNRNDTFIYILIISATTLFGNLTLWPYITKYTVKVKVNIKGIIKHISPTLWLFIPQIAISIYSVLNKIMLGSIVSVESSGFYDSSDKMIKLGLTLLTSFSTVMLPYIANGFKKKSHEEMQNIFKLSINIALGFSIPLMTMFITIAPFFVTWFFGKSFAPVIPVMMIETIVIVPLAIAGVIGPQYLLPTGKNKQYTISIFLGAIVNIIINYPLLSIWHEQGAAIATVISESIVMIVQLYFMSKKFKVMSFFSELYKYIISSFFMFIVLKLLSIFIKNSLLLLIMDGLIGISVYLIFMILLRVNMVVIMGNKIKNKFI